MSGHGQPGAPSGGPGYEVRDVNIKALLQFAFWLAMVLLVTLVSMRFTFDYLGKMTPLGSAATPYPPGPQVTPGPLLQAEPHQELGAFCAGQTGTAGSYAWLNKAGGIVQIPIDRAMDLTLQRGLPARSADEMAAAGATIPALGAAGEPDATYGQGPCGYLQEANKPPAALE